MRQKVTVVKKWGNIELSRETFVFQVPNKTTIGSQYTDHIRRTDRMLPPGHRFRGDMTI